jgi:hypothetical protein
MTTMKTILMLAILAVTPALFAAEPNPSAPARPAINAPSLPEDLAEQAALVQQIGEEAARWFDPEAHARALRAQIESLVSTSTAVKPAAPLEAAPVAGPSSRTVAKPSPSPMPAAAPATTAASSPRKAAIREAIQKARTALDELEFQLNGK